MRDVTSGSRRVSETGSRTVEENIEAAFRKRDLGERLSDHEWMLVQYASQGRTCHVCGGSVRK